MPPKKATSKKSGTKVAASSADAEVFNNVEKEVGEEINDANILPNGNSVTNVEDTKEYTKSKVAKRGSGRLKNVALELVVDSSKKKPVVKGRGKKKSNGNEVIENKIDIAQLESKEVENTNANEVKTKPLAKSGGKKREPKAKKVIKAEEDKKEAISTESNQAEDFLNGEETNLAEKNTKTVSGRKKPEVSKTGEQIEIKKELEEEMTEEKVSKKSPRNSKKVEEITAQIEPQRKKGRIAKKGKPVENDEVEGMAAVLDNVKVYVKEKKPTKRERNTAKAVIATEETLAINGDAEEVLPKKRTRKASTTEIEMLKEKPKSGRAKKGNKVKEEIENSAEHFRGKEAENATNGQVKQEKTEVIEERSSKAPSIEKEILKDKPKRGRSKKGDKVEKEIVENNAELSGKETENAINGQVKQEKIEEPHSSNKKAGKHTESAAPSPIVPTKTKGGRKRAAPSTNNKKTRKINEVGEGLEDGVDNTEMEDEADGSKPSKTKKSKTDSTPLNATETKYSKADFDLPPLRYRQTGEEPRFNLKVSSWNVAGLRSWLKKDGLKFLDYEQPDIFCMQETKCTNDKLPEEVVRIPGYHPYWLCMPGGYAGVAIYSKIMPINVEYGIGNKEFDNCGRIITAEYEKFFLINVYVPNSGRKLINLEDRMKWEKLFQQFVRDLDARKPVVICGDMNVSHQEHDLANPKTNTRNAGFTKEERDKMTELLALGYVDTFRHLYPERKGAYTFWTYMGNARSRNVGWRLDYFIVSERFIKRVVDNCIRSQCMGSDHCPITLFLKL